MRSSLPHGITALVPSTLSRLASHSHEMLTAILRAQLLSLAIDLDSLPTLNAESGCDDGDELVSASDR